MELYIRIVNGQPFEHPILGDNFKQAFPEIDVNNLSSEFARFVRVTPPVLGPYEKNQTVSYQLVGGIYTDVFACEPMTAEEIDAKQQFVKDAWAANGPYPSWVFNEVECGFYAPVAYPTDGKRYRWDEPTVSWIEVTA
jgi:hypothetical protein